MNIGKMNLLQHMEEEVEYFSTSGDLSEIELSEVIDTFDKVRTFMETL